ncbi:MAG: hypothetical protein ABSC06_02465 [Rhodopila sp.]|jgi:hypothetical protein
MSNPEMTPLWLATTALMLVHKPPEVADFIHLRQEFIEAGVPDGELVAHMRSWALKRI